MKVIIQVILVPGLFPPQKYPDNLIQEQFWIKIIYIVDAGWHLFFSPSNINEEFLNENSDLWMQVCMKGCKCCE